VEITSQHVGVAPGDGLVARIGGVVVLLTDADGPEESFSGELLTLVDEAETAGQIQGAALAWRLAELVVSRHSGGGASFGVVAPADTGWLVFLHGPVRAQITGPDGEVTLLGEHALTWVDHVVRSPVDRIAVTLAPEGRVVTDPRSDLRAGSVPGSGFAITTAPSPVGALAPARPDLPVPPVEPRRPVPPPEPVPPPVAETPVAETPVAETPIAPPASSRPRATLDLSETTVAAPATSAMPAVVGVLRADDGTQVTLDRSYVLGREPQDEPSVRSGSASPVIVADPESLISRVQAFVSVSGGIVTVRDAGSANGTFIAAPGAAEWTRVGTEPVPLKPGWSIRVGKRIFRFLQSGDGTVLDQSR
jgi:hypothetical protein